MSAHYHGAVLVPVDFSEVSSHAMDHASAMARIFGYRIYLLHIIPKKQQTKKKLREAESALTKIAKNLSDHNELNVTHLIRIGQVIETITEIADQLQVDFIVMGADKKKGQKHLVGSYPYKLVCSASVPTLVVKEKNHHVGYHNIVIPIDFSRRSTQKVTQAAKFSRFFGARIRVFGFLSYDNKAKIINKEALLKRVTNFFEESNVPVTTDLLISPDYSWPEALLKFADEVMADLIMIVAEKGSRIQEIFTPNYAERILDKSEIPVLSIVPCAEDLEEESAPEKQSIISPFVDPLGLILRPK